jgi:hypothetical protein
VARRDEQQNYTIGPLTKMIVPRIETCGSPAEHGYRSWHAAEWPIAPLMIVQPMIEG